MRAIKDDAYEAQMEINQAEYEAQEWEYEIAEKAVEKLTEQATQDE